MSKSVSFSYEDLTRRRAQQVSVPLTLDIYEWYQQMLQSHTVMFDPARASWLVFGYEEVQHVLFDQGTFSSQRSVNADGNVDPFLGMGILGIDPPRHRHLRTLISQGFTPRMVAQLEPRITAIVQALLDQVASRGEMDLVDELAFPLPIQVIAELLGVPSSDRELFRTWSAEAVSPDLAHRVAALQKIAHYFRELITQRRQASREDLVSALLQAEVDGGHLSEEELLGTCMLLLIAGHETTVGLICNALVCLDEHPESLQELLAHPELLPSAIEEVLRYRGVVHSLARVALVDTVLAGQQIKAGDLVLPLFAAANLDERQFPHAEIFDIRRSPNRHLGFGHGIHFCLGAPLARLEARIALGMLLERFPTIRRRRSMPLELKPSYFIYGLKHVPLEW
ncbi:cytochrome P450 [Dictyobacter arantiisoli]|uniref:Putative cytochrome P450 YjiB n=1 Tax=Dictyobacter arantiisoli TaxID=2014874 RepID=A0A5A5T647_9CHLR|nr:cytochrome P450 [Dictyobacter arantiisoli]GCF06921.1 putative cytochrome P450 YjiB [Dictyobacter arantiisoli]